jgi:hypothetical protein
MVKGVNAGLYNVIEKNENSIYDILLCICCNKTITRVNYTRHKKSPKHIERLQLKAESAKTPAVPNVIHQLQPQKN